MNEEGEHITMRPKASQDRPWCFGDPKNVCPKDERGFTQPQEGCLPCLYLRPCLQTALRKQGVTNIPSTETPVVSKVSRFLKRWSDQKLARGDSSDDTA